MRDPDDFTQITEFTPAMRARIANAVEALISLLDEFDGDDEDEDNGDQEALSEEVLGEFDEAEMIDDDWECQKEAWIQPLHLPGGNGD
ncbi:hypothetical protein SAMN06265338_102221 [Rhodoblastus acidophilus]|uniref:Uncharacterized protein n=1 Tax=Rhodoblastus acidophilus TaxID=1074 RepID=A0A212R0D1_RHOAC|nr:hypothetical protein [Rhodoblastus acidophilus]PPQ40469.1 hypothetical protein CKO16_01610 [Rhodoblastus acidophilus]RAI23047.1 hypothetical protein CH337_04220 [Rhodoblastus acidophilus]SNB65452.1 hypothetical protein SAMN06265338_102221 [Rhodoblastus acidophilus]